MTIFPIAYFGNISYYQQLVAAKAPIFETSEHFIKQTVRSRCEILGPNNVQKLSIPVIRTQGSKTPIHAIELEDSNWRTLHLRAIKTAYASSPFYDYYEMEIKELIEQPTNSLLTLNKGIHQRICNWLDLPLSNSYSNTFIDAQESDLDLRNNNFDTLRENTEAYTQVFNEKQNCIPNLSILDLILNQGPLARNWLLKK